MNIEKTIFIWKNSATNYCGLLFCTTIYCILSNGHSICIKTQHLQMLSLFYSSKEDKQHYDLFTNWNRSVKLYKNYVAINRVVCQVLKSKYLHIDLRVVSCNLKETNLQKIQVIAQLLQGYWNKKTNAHVHIVRNTWLLECCLYSHLNQASGVHQWELLSSKGW